MASFIAEEYELPIIVGCGHGAPIRLVVPWKNGFKGIKSIMKIKLTAAQPRTTKSEAAPNEYGFFANVNPQVDHPRWHQATEQHIGESGRRPTLMLRNKPRIFTPG